MKKVIYLDTETTGLSHVTHEVISIGGIIELDDVVVQEIELYMRPDFPVSKKSIETHGITIEQMMLYPPRRDIYHMFIEILNGYIDRYDPNDKFTVIGYNIKFDMDHLGSFFISQNDIYMRSWFGEDIDVLGIARYYRYMDKLKVDNLKLSSVAEHFAIELTAHNALSDIRATRQIFKRFCGILRGAV